jgi:hypothetical protein
VFRACAVAKVPETGSLGVRGNLGPTEAVPARLPQLAAGAEPPAAPWASCRTRCAGARSPAWCCASTLRSGEGVGGGSRGLGSSCGGRGAAHPARAPEAAHGGPLIPAGMPGLGASDPAELEARAGVPGPANAPGPPSSPAAR